MEMAKLILLNLRTLQEFDLSCFKEALRNNKKFNYKIFKNPNYSNTYYSIQRLIQLRASVYSALKKKRTIKNFCSFMD